MIKALAFAGLILVSGPDFGPSDEMFETLRDAPTEEEANDTALDIWAAWMESGSAAADLVMERAVNAQAMGDLEHAHALYDRVIAIQPNYAEAWNRRATLFLAKENYAEALRDVNEALRLEPRHFGAWGGLGAVLESLGAEDEALVAYEKALELYPHFPSAKRGVARIQQALEGRRV
ncbi:MAG: tetratricopeptide repeat protein [Henriciella sp.]|nr:tetratricopeptide repeat protein [Henriciella sp.]